MKAQTRLYIFGGIFLAVGCYQLLRNDIAEFTLYAFAAVAFAVNGLSLEPRLKDWKKALAVTGWILIAATGVVFLYMLQSQYL